jgi:phosphoribosylformylglycinamidine synthase
MDLAPALAAASEIGKGSASVRLDALLFGETQGRIVITTRALDAVKVMERAKLLGIRAMRIGTVGGDKLTIAAGAQEFQWAIDELYNLWWHSIALAMKG